MERGEPESGRTKRKGRKDAKCGNPGNEKRRLEPRGKAGCRDGTPGTERRKRYRMKPPGKRPHRLRGQRSGRTPKIPHTERRAVSQTAAGHGPRMEDAPHGGGGLSAAERRFGQLHYSHFLYLKYQMVSAEQKIIRPMAKI